MLQVHFCWGNIPNLALREALSPDHPLRRLLAVHFWRTAETITKSIVTLFPRKALLHRSTALEHNELLRLFVDQYSHFVFRTFPQQLAEQGMAGVDPNLYPLNSDGLDYHGVLSRYVQHYVDSVYASDAQLSQDAEALKFHHILNQRIQGIPYPLTKAHLHTICTEFIFRTTGYHEHMGNVNIAGLSPTMICPLLKPDKLFNAIDSAVIVGAITAATTAQTRQGQLQIYPNMDNDWSHFFTTPERVAIFRNFQAEIKALVAAIETRNRTRKWVFNDFNPVWMNLSVSA